MLRINSKNSFLQNSSQNPLISRLLMLFLLAPLLAHADAIQDLHEFIHGTPTMRATFHQTVLNSQGVKLQDVTGDMQLQRPGRFRWNYNKPFSQEIVGDGQKVWLYDLYMNQVTVRSIDKAVGSSPAALLSGSKDIISSFNLNDTGVKDGLEWVEASPKDDESGFNLVRLGFKEENLQKIELLDNFGNTTIIEFTHLERNPKLSPKLFRFTPPKGTDVTGEES